MINYVLYNFRKLDKTEFENIANLFNQGFILLNIIVYKMLYCSLICCKFPSQT